MQEGLPVPVALTDTPEPVVPVTNPFCQNKNNESPIIENNNAPRCELHLASGWWQRPGQTGLPEADKEIADGSFGDTQPASGLNTRQLFIKMEAKRLKEPCPVFHAIVSIKKMMDTIFPKPEGAAQTL